MTLATHHEGRTKPWSESDSDSVRELLASRSALRLESGAANQTAGYVRELYRTSLLSKDEERKLFERMDELKFHAAELRVMAMDLRCDESARDLREITQEIELIRNHLVESNLRLVVSVARKLRSPGTVEFHDLISEGNAILMKAVDLFKVKYGYRFSTYATTALRRGLYNYCNSDYRLRKRFVSGQEERFDSLEHDAADATAGFDASNDIDAMLKALDKRERKIVIDRFALNAGQKEKTFRELGEEFSLSKERIRQIMRGALGKMRAKLEERAATQPDDELK